MKKSLSLAAILGAIAFLGIAHAAQAQQPASSATAAPAVAPATPAISPSSPAAITYAKDRAECDALASAPSTEGAAPSDADKTVAIKKCLGAKGHSADEITKEEAAKSTVPATTPATSAPTTSTTPSAH